MELAEELRRGEHADRSTAYGALGFADARGVEPIEVFQGDLTTAQPANVDNVHEPVFDGGNEVAGNGRLKNFYPADDLVQTLVNGLRHLRSSMAAGTAGAGRAGHPTGGPDAVQRRRQRRQRARTRRRSTV